MTFSLQVSVVLSLISVQMRLTRRLWQPIGGQTKSMWYWNLQGYKKRRDCSSLLFIFLWSLILLLLHIHHFPFLGHSLHHLGHHKTCYQICHTCKIPWLQDNLHRQTHQMTWLHLLWMQWVCSLLNQWEQGTHQWLNWFHCGHQGHTCYSLQMPWVLWGIHLQTYHHLQCSLWMVLRRHHRYPDTVQWCHQQCQEPFHRTHWVQCEHCIFLSWDGISK